MDQAPQPGRERRRSPFQLILIRRGTIFFLAMGLLAVFLYAVGIPRQFTGATQFMLLRLGAFFGAVLGITGLLGVIIDLGFLVYYRRFHSPGKFVFTVAAAALGFLLTAAASFVLALTGGNIP